MPDDVMYALTKDEYDDFVRMHREWKARPRSTPADSRRGPVPDMPGAVVALLDDCDSMATVSAAVLRKAVTFERQFLDVRGQLSVGGSPTWRIRYWKTAYQSGDSEVTAALSATATPLDVLNALLALDSFRDGDLKVSLGYHERIDVDGTWDTRRWIVEFTGQFKGTVTLLDPEILTGDASFTSSATAIHEDTGATIDVTDTVPVGSPTPLRAGSVANTTWKESYGYCIDAVEARSVPAFSADSYA